jgi:hypothetical protein
MTRFALALALFTAACGGAMGTSIEMKGKDPDLAAVAGTWMGNYQAQETGRTGNIEFELALGRHVAVGQVMMGGSHKSLHVTFVNVEHNTVSGTMEPYTDPGCNCQVTTRFTGTVEGNEIDGTFTTKIADGSELHGTWKVARADQSGS